MPEFHRVAIVAPKGDFNKNVLPEITAGLAAAFEACGLDVVFIDSTAPEFRRQLLQSASDPATALYAGHFFYDLGLTHSVESGTERMNLFEALDRPVFARIGDHPFAEFMWGRIEGASKTTHFLLPSMEFKPEIQFINPALKHFHLVMPSLTMSVSVEDEVPPLEGRPIDIFMPCGFKNILPSVEELRQRFEAKGNPMVRVIDETLEAGVTERDRPIMDIYMQAIQRHFGARFVTRTPLAAGDREILQVLSTVDFRVRTIRRINVVENLARLDPALRIVITIPETMRETMPQLQDRSNIDLIGTVDTARARSLYLQSKFVVNVNPTYVSLMSERVRNAMALGCCVVSDKNSHSAQTFAEGEEILFMEGYDPASVSRYFKDGLDEAQAIAARARRRALSDFPISKLADDIIAVMQDVL